MIEKVLNLNKGVLSVKPLQKLSHPILKPSKEGFDSKNIYNPTVVKVKDTIIMLYRAESKKDKITGRIGLALSQDGINFLRHPEPILEPEYDYEVMGVEDPRVVKVGNTYYMTYTGYDGKTAKLCIASSKNLVNWKKHGVVFEDFPQTKDWTKSGAILPQKLEKGEFKGKYIMYFGDSNIWLAYSNDLINWEYIENPVLKPRKDNFDNVLVEPGPFTIMTELGILLIYNSAGKEGDTLKYKVGVALFDKEDPTKLIARTEKPILEPTYEWEINGWVNNVVFVEGLIEHDNKIYIYYGGADKYIGLAYWEV
jgi:predicted GH43/DUF377 family glycosyl hydrolase